MWPSSLSGLKAARQGGRERVREEIYPITWTNGCEFGVIQRERVVKLVRNRGFVMIASLYPYTLSMYCCRPSISRLTRDVDVSYLCLPFVFSSLAISTFAHGRRAMLISTFVPVISLLFLSGCLAAQSYYQLLGSELRHPPRWNPPPLPSTSHRFRRKR